MWRYQYIKLKKWELDQFWRHFGVNSSPERGSLYFRMTEWYLMAVLSHRYFKNRQSTSFGSHPLIDRQNEDLRGECAGLKKKISSSRRTDAHSQSGLLVQDISTINMSCDNLYTKQAADHSFRSFSSFLEHSWYCKTAMRPFFDNSF